VRVASGWPMGFKDLWCQGAAEVVVVCREIGYIAEVVVVGEGFGCIAEVVVVAWC
jgi:hypothetical protein